jgi:hypothetical protein
MNRPLRISAILLALLAVPACSDPEPVPDTRTGSAVEPAAPVAGAASDPEPGRIRPTIASNYQGEFAAVPADSGASYRVLANDRLAGGTRQVVTRRDGRDGTLYVRWELDCAGATFRRLGEGTSVDRALDDLAEIAPLAPMTPIAADIARYACPGGG